MELNSDFHPFLYNSKIDLQLTALAESIAHPLSNTEAKEICFISKSLSLKLQQPQHHPLPPPPPPLPSHVNSNETTYSFYNFNDVIESDSTSLLSPTLIKYFDSRLNDLLETLIRDSAVNASIWIKAELLNPFQIPIECVNLKLYGILIPVASSNVEGEKTDFEYFTSFDKFHVSNDPISLMMESSDFSSLVEFPSQQIRFNPGESRFIRLQAIPKSSGQLYILGIRWDLYGTVKVRNEVKKAHDSLVSSELNLRQKLEAVV